MEIEKLHFNQSEILGKPSMADVAKDTEEKVIAFIADNIEISNDDYLNAVAKILFERFGRDREGKYAEYLVCESIAMAFAIKAMPGGRFAPFKENYFREDIRSAINDLEEKNIK